MRALESSNCLGDSLEILHVSSRRKAFVDPILPEDPLPPSIIDHDYIATMWTLNPYIENVVEYISGYIVAKLIKMKICTICQQQIVSDTISPLIAAKNRGPYIYPATDVCNICKAAEQIFRQYMQK